MTNRKAITKFLSELLINRFNMKRTYWASEVTLDYGTKDVKRVDFMQFEPANQMSISGIEKGIFTCYEIKSCKADFNSGFGRNFIGDKNYFVMTMETYLEVIHEIPHNVGVLVTVPIFTDLYDQFENPKHIDELNLQTEYWELKVIQPAHTQDRKRSMVELLFCMLRSGK